MKRANVTALGFLALAILIAIPLGLNRSFARLREDAQSSYYYDNTGYGIWEGLELRRDRASDLVTLGEKYAGQNPALAPLADALAYRVKLCETYSYDLDDLDREVAADRLLGQEAADLAQALEETELSAQDEKYPRQLLADLMSEADKIQRSSYNDDARAYNARLEKFPVNILKGIARIKAMAVFEEETA